MPTLAQLRAKTAANQAAANNPNGADNPAPTITPENLVQIPAAAPLDLPVPMPQRGVFPTSMVLASDRSDSTRVFRGPNTRSAVFQNSPSQVSATVTTPVTAATIAAALAVLVNNKAVPDQDVLNFLSTTTIQVVAGPNGQISFNSTASFEGDGIIHGQGNIDSGSWESDPAYVIMRDDFFSAGASGGAVTTTGVTKIGDLGWNVISPNGAGFCSSLGAPPNLGTFNFDNDSTINEAGIIVLTSGSVLNASALSNDNAMALLEYPSWKATYIWKTDFSFQGTRQHTTTQKAMYVGFVAGDYAGSVNANLSSRPNTFMGIRFDTSTSPGTLSVTSVANASGGTTVYTIASNVLGNSNGFANTTFVTTNCGNAANNGTFLCTASTSTTITLLNAAGVSATGLTGSAKGPTPPNDSFYTFEVVDNAVNPSTSYGRNNQQGQTFVTNVVPVAGAWHRLDIECTAVGVVTMTLDGSTINTATFTVPVQTIAITGTSNITATNSNGSTQISWSGSGPAAGGFATKWARGSQIAVSGFSSAYSGTFRVGAVLGPEQIVYNNPSGTGVSQPSSATISGYPAWIPTFWFGNDDTASPTGNSICYYVDFFSFIWNPGVGGGSGTPAITNSRYFPSVTD